MTDLSARIRALSVLGAVISHAEKVTGRVRLQKILYLLREQGVSELAGVPFAYGHYGPFSQEVTSALQYAVATEAVEERTESTEDEWQCFEYLPGPKLNEVACSSDEVVEKVNATLSVLRDSHWRALQLATTIRFLAASRGYDATKATSWALKLQPHCASFKTDALRILSETGLGGQGEIEAVKEAPEVDVV